MSTMWRESDEALDEAVDDALDEALYESDESDEARRSYGRGPITVARPAPSPPPPPPAAGGGQVTRAEFQVLQADVSRLNDAIRTNSTALERVNSRAAAVEAAQRQQTTAVRRETAQRRREVSGVRRDLNQTRELAGVLPLISQSSRTLTSAAGGLASGTRVLVSDDGIGSLLPLVLLSGGFGGSGSSGGSGSDSGSGGSGDMSLLVLALALSGRR